MSDENSPKTSGEIISRMKEIRAERAKISKQDDILKSEWSNLEAALISKLDGDGTQSTKSNGTSATITETVVADVQDWDKLYQFIKDNDAFYMLQRRVNNKPYQEQLDAGTEVPGVQKFTRRAISLRSS